MDEDERAERIRRDLAMLQTMKRCKPPVTVSEFSRPTREVMILACGPDGPTHWYLDGTGEHIAISLDDAVSLPVVP